MEPLTLIIQNIMAMDIQALPLLVTNLAAMMCFNFSFLFINMIILMYLCFASWFIVNGFQFKSLKSLASIAGLGVGSYLIILMTSEHAETILQFNIALMKGVWTNPDFLKFIIPMIALLNFFAFFIAKKKDTAV